MLHLFATKKLPDHHPVIYFLMAFIAMAGLSYINFLPAVVNALAGNIGFTAVEAGQIVAANGYGGLLGSCIAIFMVRRFRWYPAMLTFLALLALLDLATAWVGSYGLMLAWRFLAGVFGGLSIGLAFSVLARWHNPDRAFGALLFVQFSIGSLVIYLLPGLEHISNAYAVFYLMAGIAVLAMAFMLCLPPLTLTSASAQTAGQHKAGPTRNHRELVLLAVIGLYQAAASALWAYVGQIGLAANHSLDKVSTYIAITGLLGLAGALFPMISGRRFGRLVWLTLGMALSSTAAVLLNFSQHSAIYMIAMGLLFFAWPAVLAYLLAVSAELDCSGRLSTMAAVVSSVGVATGPLLASALLEYGGFALLLYACAIIFIISFVLLIKPVQAQEKQRPTATAAAVATSRSTP